MKNHVENAVIIYLDKKKISEHLAKMDFKLNL
jgi:hypothetical protein